MYDIVFRPKAEDHLSGLHKELQERIIAKLRSIRDFPEHYFKWINTYNVHPMRIGDYRAFIDLKADKEIIRILAILHRDQAYEGWG